MSLPHDSAHLHVTGKSEYVDDRLPLPGEVHLGVLFSKEAHARIKKIDCSAALKHPALIQIFTAKDFAHNLWGTIFQDQPLIADDVVRFVGEPLAVIVSSDRFKLQEIRNLIRVEYEKLPAILSIKAARKASSFIADERKIERGHVEKALKGSKHRLKGDLVIQGADHFYLESQAAIAYPLEDGQIEVHSSSQHPTEVQHVVAHALGIQDQAVVCIVKRMGGGFGGKESQAAPFAAFAALAAHRLKRSARLILSKDDDMIMTGKRNPFETEYEVGFDAEGRIHALDVALFSDGGAYADLSTSIMERAMLHCDNAYFLPSARIRGRVCKTHYHPHTAFRGFGGPKGVATIEKIIEEIAHFLGKDPLDVRKLNCYQGDRLTTPYGQVHDENLLPELFEKLEKTSEYRKRRKEISSHNERVVTGKEETLRGLSMTAVKFGIAFTTRFLNQGNALVHVHRDGSIQVSTGATEMGQGVNARIADLLSEEFGLTRDHIRVMPTRTDKNANTSPTAASSGTDLNGSAAVLAARKIRVRLAQLAVELLGRSPDSWPTKTAGMGTLPEITVQDSFQAHHPNEPFEDYGVLFKDGFAVLKKSPDQKISFPSLVKEAYLSRISISDYAHYSVPHLSFNKAVGQGDAFLYFTQGVAASEVSLSMLTGELKVLRTDLLMDLGRPINRDLDLGQVYGGFIQGMGWVTTENLFYSDGGMLLSHSPSTYKIPSVHDTPRIFNVDLIPSVGYSGNIRGTKAVGEPPLLLCLSVWTAIQDALRSLPRYRNLYPSLPIPATQEKILRALHPDIF